MAKHSNGDEGKTRVDNLKGLQRVEAYKLAGEVVGELDKALSAFSTRGVVGNRINNGAPNLLMNDDAVLAVLPNLSTSELASMREALLNALLDPQFLDTLDNFQYNLASSDLKQQVRLLEGYTSIDWEAIARGVPADAGAFERVQAFLGIHHVNKQIKAAEKARLSELIVLCQIPQFTQMLVLAVSYGKIMLLAYQMYEQNKAVLERDEKQNRKLIKELERIAAEFGKAEDERLQGAADISKYSKMLERALENAEVLAEMKNRTQDMASRVEISKKLVEAMIFTSGRTLESQELLISEMSKDLHVFTGNMTREPRVNMAIQALNLYIRTYCAFEYILALVQVYLIIASSALRSMIAQQIQRTSGAVGTQYYLENIQPLKEMVSSFAASFELPDPNDDNIVDADAKDA